MCKGTKQKVNLTSKRMFKVRAIKRANILIGETFDPGDACPGLPELFESAAYNAKEATYEKSQ